MIPRSREIGRMGYELMKAITRMIDAAAIAAAVVFFVAGCGGERPDPPPKQAAGKTAVSADKAAIPANRVEELEKEGVFVFPEIVKELIFPLMIKVELFF